jgi:hypothetical protein
MPAVENVPGLRSKGKRMQQQRQFGLQRIHQIAVQRRKGLQRRSTLSEQKDQKAKTANMLSSLFSHLK